MMCIINNLCPQNDAAHNTVGTLHSHLIFKNNKTNELKAGEFRITENKEKMKCVLRSSACGSRISS